MENLRTVRREKAGSRKRKRNKKEEETQEKERVEQNPTEASKKFSKRCHQHTKFQRSLAVDVTNFYGEYT